MSVLNQYFHELKFANIGSTHVNNYKNMEKIKIFLKLLSITLLLLLFHTIPPHIEKQLDVNKTLASSCLGAAESNKKVQTGELCVCKATGQAVIKQSCVAGGNGCSPITCKKGGSPQQ